MALESWKLGRSERTTGKELLDGWGKRGEEAVGRLIEKPWKGVIK